MKWKCNVDSEPNKKRVLIYDQIQKTISGADFVKPKNIGQPSFFVLDCGGIKKMTDVVFYCDCPEMDQQILRVYKNHLE